MSRTFQDLKAPKIYYKAPLLAHTLRMRKIFAIRHGKWYGRTCGYTEGTSPAVDPIHRN